ncbi:MAG: electron transfer flavoprotein subunit alpha [candidate division KSB1 bacterium]|nr:electron transfer flavoprotein subunit alpha [candidate division KSB1 bacterium]
MKILVLSHTEENKLPDAAREALTAAKQLGPVSFGLWGANTQDAANALADADAEKVYVVTGEEFDAPRYSTDIAAAEALVKASGADVIVAGHTPRTARIQGGLAARLDGVVDTHVSGLNADADAISATRWFYRQRIKADVKRANRPWIIGVDAGVFEPFSGSDGQVEVQQVSVEVTDQMTRTKVKGIAKPESDEQTIQPDAELLLVAGAGWTKQQAEGGIKVDQAADLILDVLRKSGASLGGTKSMVDMESEGQKTLHFMTHMNQIGQTGSTPRHKKGLATCCHGEEPHVVGWRFINERRAINLDANCGWAHGKADVLYIADAFKVMDELRKLL